MNNTTLKVSEHFLSIQGEGQTMGRPSYFLRLANCNLLCGGVGTVGDGLLHNGATWRCDSIEVWKHGMTMRFSDIVEEMGGDEFLADIANGVHLIITGGEPLLQREAILEFIKYCIERMQYQVKDLSHIPIIEVETNGTIDPGELIHYVRYWNVSPKLSNCGMNYTSRFRVAALCEFAKLGNSIFKFVISCAADFEEMMKDYWPLITGTCKTLAAAQQKIYLMPAADNSDDLQRVSQEVAALAIKNRFCFSYRIHIAVWNKKTGV